MNQTKESWHLDKKVPIALILTVLLQAGAFIWWARGIDKMVDSQEARIANLEKTAGAVSQAISNIQVDVARIDERSKAQSATLEEIRRALRP